MREYINEFDKRNQKFQSYRTQMTKQLLRYKLLKLPNLSTKDKQVVKAKLKYVSELKYEDIKS